MAIIAKEKIRHSGEDYTPGELIEKISSKDEARLIRLGAAEKYKAPKLKEKEKEDGGKKEGE